MNAKQHGDPLFLVFRACFAQAPGPFSLGQPIYHTRVSVSQCESIYHSMHLISEETDSLKAFALCHIVISIVSGQCTGRA